MANMKKDTVKGGNKAVSNPAPKKAGKISSKTATVAPAKSGTAKQKTVEETTIKKPAAKAVAAPAPSKASPVSKKPVAQKQEKPAKVEAPVKTIKKPSAPVKEKAT